LIAFSGLPFTRSRVKSGWFDVTVARLSNPHLIEGFLLGFEGEVELRRV
jgi:hypothetical protein